MRSYIVTTGAAFGVLALAHIARILDEGAHLVGQPIFLSQLETTEGAFAPEVWRHEKPLTRPG